MPNLRHAQQGLIFNGFIICTLMFCLDEIYRCHMLYLCYMVRKPNLSFQGHAKVTSRSTSFFHNHCLKASKLIHISSVMIKSFLKKVGALFLSFLAMFQGGNVQGRCQGKMSRGDVGGGVQQEEGRCLGRCPRRDVLEKMSRRISREKCPVVCGNSCTGEIILYLCIL